MQYQDINCFLEKKLSLHEGPLYFFIKHNGGLLFIV